MRDDQRFSSKEEVSTDYLPDDQAYSARTKDRGTVLCKQSLGELGNKKKLAPPGPESFS